MNLSHIHSKADLIIALDPRAADAVIPHGPVLSNATIDLFVADVVKDISAKLADKGLAALAMSLSKTMAKQATASMVSSWEPGDDICPPWRWPFPRPWPWQQLIDAGPVPDPWVPVRAGDQIELANLLTHLAGMTTSAEFNQELKGLATNVARGVASTLVDDFEQCGTVPRKPFPPRHLTAVEAGA
jgi:hypothetical protein